MVGKQRRTVKKLHKRRNILKGYSKKKSHYIQKKSRRKKTSYKRKRPNKRTRGKRRKFILSGGWNPTMAQKEELAQTAMDGKFGVGRFDPSVFGLAGYAAGIKKIVTRAEVLFPLLKKKDADAAWVHAVNPITSETYYYDKHGHVVRTPPTMRMDGRNVLEGDRAFWMMAMQLAAEEVESAGLLSDNNTEEERKARRRRSKSPVRVHSGVPPVANQPSAHTLPEEQQQEWEEEEGGCWWGRCWR